ncbi:glycosyltransferase family 4 protein [Vibrio fluvialis]|nr:glycosyltransferase family 4 protein [Vibrio fluvialis]
MIFIGPSLNFITGQSLAFNTFYNWYNGEKKVFHFPDYNSIWFKNVFSNVFFLFSLYKCFIFEKSEFKTIYLTTSRSRFGFVRDFLIILPAKFFSYRIVNHLHGADFSSFRSEQNKFFKKLIDYTYTCIDDSIVLLESMKEQYSIYPRMRKHVVSNFYSNDIIFDKHSHDYSDKLQLLFLSNIMYSKGIIYLVDAVEELYADGYDIFLNIAGSVIPDEYMNFNEINTAFYDSISKSKACCYIGTVVGHEKVELLKKSDIFVLPSFYRTEAQPISVIEAMASGCAIISTNHNYLPDMVGDNNGLLVEVKSKQAIKDAILYYYQNRDKLKEVSKNNYTEAKEKYKLESYITKLSKIVNGIE